MSVHVTTELSTPVRPAQAPGKKYLKRSLPSSSIMSLYLQHTSDTGHTLIVENQGGEWEGFCFECSLAFIFDHSAEVPFDYEPREQVIQLIRNCVSAVGESASISKLVEATYFHAEAALMSRNGQKSALAVLCLADLIVRESTYCVEMMHQEELARRCCDRALYWMGKGRHTLAWVATLWCRAAIMHADEWRVAASYTNPISLQVSAPPFIVRSSQLFDAFLNMAGGPGSLDSTEQSLIMLKVEFTALVSALLDLEEGDGFWSPTSEQVHALVRYMAAEIVARDYTGQLTAVRQSAPAALVLRTTSGYRTDLFRLITCMIRNLSSLAVDAVTTVVLRNTQQDTLQRLALAAVELASRCDSNSTAGLVCMCTLLQSCSVTPQLMVIARRLLEDGCRYSSRLCGMWDTSGHHTPTMSDSSRLDSIIGQTLHLLAVGCPERFFHYTCFTAKMCTAILQHYVAGGRQLIRDRRYSPARLAQRGPDEDHQHAPEGVRGLRQVLEQALQVGACSASAQAAIHSQCAVVLEEALTGLSERPCHAGAKAAAICALTHVLPLVQCNLGGNSALPDGATPTLVALQLLVRVLQDGHTQGSESSDSLRDRPSAVLACIQCLNADKPTVVASQSDLQACAVLISAACGILASPASEDFESEIELRQTLFCELVLLLAEASAAPLATLYATAYSCRTLHQALAVYATHHSPLEDRVLGAYCRFVFAASRFSFSDSSPEGPSSVSTRLLHAALSSALQHDAYSNHEVDALSLLCSVYIAACLKRPVEVGAVALHSKTEAASAAGLSILALSMIGDPLTLCDTTPATVRYLLRTVAEARLPLRPGAAAVRFTYELLMTTPGSETHMLLAPSGEPDVDALCDYWAGCDTSAGNHSVSRHMLQKYLLRTASATLLAAGATKIGASLPEELEAMLGRLRHVVQILPVAAFAELLPTLETVVTQLKGGAAETSDCLCAKWWPLILEALVKERLSAVLELQGFAQSTDSGVRVLAECDRVLSLLHGGIALARRLSVASQESSEVAMFTSLTQQTTEALAAFAVHIAVHYRVGHPVINRFERNADLRDAACNVGAVTLLEEVAEFMRRSGWLEQLVRIGELPVSEQVFTGETLLHCAVLSAANLPSTASVCLSAADILKWQLRRPQEGGPSPVEQLQALLRDGAPATAGGEVETLDFKTAAVDSAVKFAASCYTATLSLLESESQQVAPNEGESIATGSAVLHRCWLLRCQEVLLFCQEDATSKRPTDASTAELAAQALREIRYSAAMHCSAHLCLSGGYGRPGKDGSAQQTLERQAYHSLWLPDTRKTSSCPDSACILPSYGGVAFTRSAECAHTTAPVLSQEQTNEVRQLVLLAALRLQRLWVEWKERCG